MSLESKPNPSVQLPARDVVHTLEVLHDVAFLLEKRAESPQDVRQYTEVMKLALKNLRTHLLPSVDSEGQRRSLTESKP